MVNPISKSNNDSHKDEENKLDPWADTMEKLIKWQAILNGDSIKRICNIGGWGYLSTLYCMIKTVDCAVVISQEISEDIFKIRDEIYPYFRGNSNTRKKNILHLIEADARYKEGLKDILTERLSITEKELKKYFNLLIISKTLHHLRSGKCQVHRKSPNKKGINVECIKDPDSCVFEFKTDVLYNLVSYGEKTLIWELIEPNFVDTDKEDGVGGHLTRREFWEILRDLDTKGYIIEFFFPPIKPLDFSENAQIPIYPGTIVGFTIEKP